MSKLTMNDPRNIRIYSRRMTIDTLLAYYGRTRENADKFNAMTDEQLSQKYKEILI